MKKALLLVFCLSLVAAGCKKKNDMRTAQTGSNPAMHLKDANNLLARRQCPEAVQYYQKYLDKDPRHAGAWNSLGLAYLCISKPVEAISAFQQSLLLDPTFSDVHNNLGVAYTESKNFASARDEFRKALADISYPKAGPYFNLARIAFMEGKYEESRALAKKVIDFQPTQVGPKLLFGISLEKLGRYDEAVAAYREVLKLDSKNLEASFNLANILLRAHKDCEARELFNRVIDEDPLGELGQKAINAVKSVRCPASAAGK